MTGTTRPASPQSPLTALVPVGDTLHAVAERTYRAPRADVWAAWTEPDRLARWLGTPSGDLAPGGAYRLVLGDGEDELVTGTVLACEPPARLVATWVLPDGSSSEVEVTFDEHADGTLLRLEHRGLPANQTRGYAAGWHVYADDLGALLAGERPAGTWEERFDAVLPTYLEAEPTPRS